MANKNSVFASRTIDDTERELEYWTRQRKAMGIKTPQRHVRADISPVRTKTPGQTPKAQMLIPEAGAEESKQEQFWE